MSDAQPARPTGPPPADWIAGLPQKPSRSSAGLGWRCIEAHRFDGLHCSGLELPAVERHFIAVHLLRPCQVDARWDGRTHRARSVPGNAMVMAAGQYSSWNCSSAMDEMHMFLDPRILEEVAREVGAAHFQLIDGVGLLDPGIGEIARQLLAEIDNPDLGSNLFADTIARTLALHLLRRHSTVGTARSEPRVEITARQLRVATDYIECHLDQELTLERIAAALAMSPFRFARAFRKATGQSPRQYVIGRRIHYARELLRSTDCALIDVANRAGFSTQSHFTSVFRNRCGMTPKRFRNRLRH